MKPLRGNKIENKIQETDINPDIQTLFTNTKATTKKVKIDYKMRV